MSTYYNEFDPAKAHMLRALIAEGLIAPGDVDERSIKDVKPTELYGYDQCHFFAGIGGWSLALRLAGWPDDRPVWTGSCPCQPFSDAGKGLAEADERHLWPMFFRLIRECRPGVVFGEQVASAAALRWWDGVSHDLETADYACGAVDICAASVGAPHIRQRLYWVANAGSGAGERDAGSVLEAQAGIGGAGQQHGDLPLRPEHGGASGPGGLADAELQRAGRGEPGEQGQPRQRRAGLADDGTTGGLGDAAGRGCGVGGDASRAGSGG
ncbi:MAG TPA: DNA cytosine methyltransferase, partial [Phycisphaerae bacterium]|nr:DNA cytosine methyltransferase [Phycisphaerae bacterium]